MAFVGSILGILVKFNFEQSINCVPSKHLHFSGQFDPFCDDSFVKAEKNDENFFFKLFSFFKITNF